MPSVRFDDELESRLERAVEVSGQSASDLIRHGTRKICDEVLGETLYDRIKHLVGSLASSPAARKRTNARRTGAAMRRILRKKAARRK